MSELRVINNQLGMSNLKASSLMGDSEELTVLNYPFLAPRSTYDRVGMLGAMADIAKSLGDFGLEFSLPRTVCESVKNDSRSLCNIVVRGSQSVVNKFKMEADSLTMLMG